MSGAVRVTDSVSIPRDELTVRASRAGGAGGQHVNTSSTRIEIVWGVMTSRALDDAQRAHVLGKLASRLDAGGHLRVVSSARRSQRQNLEAGTRGAEASRGDEADARIGGAAAEREAAARGAEARTRRRGRRVGRSLTSGA
jgi:ribosome-associated protein